MPILDEPLVWTPSAVKAELSRVRGVLDAVNADVSAAVGKGQLSATEWTSWRQLYEAGHKYVDEASTIWGSSAVQARDFERQAGTWRDLVKARGGTASGVGPRKPAPPAWDTAAIIGLLLVGYVAYKVLDRGS